MTLSIIVTGAVLLIVNMLSVAFFIVMLSVVMLSVVLLSVVAPLQGHFSELQ
jgi:hypothetical protein